MVGIALGTGIELGALVEITLGNMVVGPALGTLVGTALGIENSGWN